MGVFTWWAEGSEKDGLAELEKLFEEKYPNNTFVNLAVAGGAGSNAKAKLAADLQNNNPPDSFQGHAGAELMDYIDAENPDYARTMAGVLIASLPTLIVYIVLGKYFISGLMSGSVK